MKTPTDLELMMFADGELSEPRCSEVARFLASGEDAASKSAHAKLVGLAAVGEIVREQASRLATLHAADGIADLVMKSIETADGATSDQDASSAAKAIRAPRLVGRSQDAASPATHSKRVIEPKAKAANDNNRFIYAMAGLAAAAAVALGVWGRTAPTPEASGREPVVRDVPVAASSAPLVLTAQVAQVDSSTSPAPADSSGAHPDDSAGDDGSVKVASVDFGAKTGTVFYVPKDKAGATTAVVWLAEQ